MLRTLLPLLVLIVLPRTTTGQSAATLIDKYEHLNPADPEKLASCEALDTGAFWAVLRAVVAEEARQGTLSGRASIGFAGDEAGDRELYRVHAGVQLSRGKYPAEVDVSSSVGVTFDGDRFRENVSLVRINVDYHPRLWLENFVFLDRFSDSFLGIDQRYETGAGTIFNHWGGLTAAGRGRRETLEQVAFDLPADELERAAWVRCWDALYDGPAGALADAARLDKLQQDALKANQKRYYRLRAALLLGVLAELETATVTGDALVQMGESIAAQTLILRPDARQQLRWEVRPTLDLQPSDNWRLKARWYFKLPVPGDFYEDVPRTDGAGEVVQDAAGEIVRGERFDYRSEIYTELSVNLADELSFQSGSIGVSLSYQRLFDNAPPSGFIEGRVGPEGLPIFLIAEDTHHLVRFQVTVGF